MLRDGREHHARPYFMTSSLPPTERSLPIALLRARDGVMAPIRKMLAETGITEQQWRVLRVVSEHGPMDASSLADQASLLYPSLTRISNSMREKGLLTQTRDKADRRRMIVAITSIGQSIIDSNADQAAQIAADFKMTLGEEQYEQLLDLLALLAPQTRS